MSRESVEATTLADELAQAVADLVHLRQLVAERRVNGAALCVAEYRVTGLRRRLATLAALAATTGEDPPGGEGVAS